MSYSIKGTVAGSQSIKGTLKDIPSLDNTLTKEGYAADAKAVGEALKTKAPISHTEDRGNPHGVTASQVGARPDTWMPSASEIGAATPADVQKAAPVNLLDNSDLGNPVNERGFTAHTGDPVYCIDRWKISSRTGESYLDTSNKCFVLYSTSDIGQILEDKTRYLGKTLTLAACDENNTVHVASGTINRLPTGNEQVFPVDKNDGVLRLFIHMVGTLADLYVYVQNVGASSLGIQWAALYEGEYTAETLPRYQPKGYGAELMECKRYLQVYKPQIISGQNWHAPIGMGLANGANVMEFDIPLSVPLRKGVLPSLLHSGDFSAWNGTDVLTPTDFGVSSISDAVLRVNCQVTGAEIGRPYSLAVLNTNMDGYFMINAEL